MLHVESILYTYMTYRQSWWYCTLRVCLMLASTCMYSRSSDIALNLTSQEKSASVCEMIVFLCCLVIYSWFHSVKRERSLQSADACGFPICLISIHHNAGLCIISKIFLSWYSCWIHKQINESFWVKMCVCTLVDCWMISHAFSLTKFVCLCNF